MPNVFYKSPILFFVVFYSLLLYPKTLNSDDQPKTKNNVYVNIDSLRIKINNSGWNNFYLKNYQHYLINSKIDFKDELNKLKNFKPSFEESYLISLILKRQNKFNEMYDSLSEHLNEDINYFPFYNELIFSALSTNQLSVLESKVERIKIPNKKYLQALIFSSRGKYKNALRFLQNLFEKDSADFEIAYQLSYTYRNLGDYKNASDVLKRIKNIDDWDKTKKYLAKGSLYFLSGNYSEASKYYQKGLELSKKINDKQTESKAMINIAIIYDVYGDTKNARDKFYKAINLSKSINDLESEALGFSELGVSYSFTNELIKAKKNYLKSYKLYETIGNKLRLALLSNNLGKIFMTMFDYQSAINYYQKGIDFSGENKRAQALNLMGLADVYANLSNYSKALEFYRQAKKISSQINELTLEAEIDYGLGALNFNLDRFDNALKYFSSAKKIIGNSDPYLIAQIYNQTGLTYFQLDSLTTAQNYFNKSLKTSREINDTYSEALANINLALVSEKKKDINNSLSFIEKAKNISKKSGYKYFLAQSFLIEGNINKSLGNYKKAKINYLNALNLGRNLNEFNTQIDADYNLAKLFEKNNLKDEAELYYKSAVKLIEDVSQPLFKEDKIQIAYNSSKNEVYNSFADFYLKNNEYEKAFELIDKSRSQNTMSNLKNLKLQSLIKNDSLLNKIYDCEWLIHSGIYSKEKIDSVKNQFTSLKKLLIKKEPQLKKYLDKKKNFSVEEVQNKLNTDENFLSVYTTDNFTYLFLIKKNNFYHFIINVSKDSLKKLVTSISPYFSYSNNSSKIFYNQDLFSFNIKAAYNFYNEIIKPAFEKIPKGWQAINSNEKVIISSSSELITLPFEFLVTKYDQSKSSYDYNTASYLIFKYDISYTPSASVFIQQKINNFDNNNKVLLVGDPAINNKFKNYSERRGLLEETGGLPRNVNLLPLKYSADEINQISEIINANKILIEKNATETNFKNNAPLSKVIHLSTHSFLFNKQPVIFFSNFYDSENDGFLEAGEIVQLKLNCNLVVLSSCSSGLGIIDESEGILGMTKAFFEAGAKSVVVSLWEVNDKFTSKFMELFYKNLSDGLDKSEALRMAKINFIKKYSANPYYWAAFTLNGDVSKVNLKTSYSALPLIIILLLITATASVLVFWKIKR